jgi:hypothetical protein
MKWALVTGAFASSRFPTNKSLVVAFRLLSINDETLTIKNEKSAQRTNVLLVGLPEEMDTYDGRNTDQPQSLRNPVSGFTNVSKPVLHSQASSFKPIRKNRFSSATIKDV